MFFNFFVDSGNLFHFEGPKKESEFWPAKTCGQVLVLPSRRLVHPASDDDFVKK